MYGIHYTQVDFERNIAYAYLCMCALYNVCIIIHSLYTASQSHGGYIQSLSRATYSVTMHVQTQHLLI